MCPYTIYYCRSCLKLLPSDTLRFAGGNHVTGTAELAQNAAQLISKIWRHQFSPQGQQRISPSRTLELISCVKRRQQLISPKLIEDRCSTQYTYHRQPILPMTS